MRTSLQASVFTLAGFFRSHSATQKALNEVAVLFSSGLLDTSVLTPDALVWADGQDGWKALKDQAALYSQVYQISAAGASKPPALQRAFLASTRARFAGTRSFSQLTYRTDPAAESRPTTSAARPGAVTAAAPTPSAAAPADRQLAEFQAEMAALGEDVGYVLNSKAYL